MKRNVGLGIPTEFKLEDWMLMEPSKGPPLPKFLNIYWPWYKKEVPPEVPVLAYGCPYCDRSFDTLKELVDHVAADHPDKPPLQEIEIQWT